MLLLYIISMWLCQGKYDMKKQFYIYCTDFTNRPLTTASSSRRKSDTKCYLYLFRIARRSPLCVATKPFEIVATVLRAPHELHTTKYKRDACSLSKSVSGDLHILQVTYSPIYFFSSDSIFLLERMYP